VRNVRANPPVTLVVDHYTEDWSDLGWVQVRGTAGIVRPEVQQHQRGVDALREKYDQYASHALEDRPVIRIEPGRVVSWGSLERPTG
jgi:PPOX class probable F420-dependent enzyme